MPIKTRSTSPTSRILGKPTREAAYCTPVDYRGSPFGAGPALPYRKGSPLYRALAIFRDCSNPIPKSRFIELGGLEEDFAKLLKAGKIVQFEDNTDAAPYSKAETGEVVPTATVLTDRFDRALLYATHVHGGQVRKKTGIPYIAHLMAVAATVLEYDGSEDMAIAGLLHDAVEDQGGPPRLNDIRNRFGSQVAMIVSSCSDSLANTSAGEAKTPYRQRKQQYIDGIRNKDKETLLVSLSDKIHNARSILRDLRKPEVGPRVWKRFSGSKKDTVWYYNELAKAFQARMPKHQLANELGEIVSALQLH